MINHFRVRLHSKISPPFDINDAGLLQRKFSRGATIKIARRLFLGGQRNGCRLIPPGVSPRARAGYFLVATNKEAGPARAVAGSSERRNPPGTDGSAAGAELVSSAALISEFDEGGVWRALENAHPRQRRLPKL